MSVCRKLTKQVRELIAARRILSISFSMNSDSSSSYVIVSIVMSLQASQIRTGVRTERRRADEIAAYALLQSFILGSSPAFIATFFKDLQGSAAHIQFLLRTPAFLADPITPYAGRYPGCGSCVVNQSCLVDYIEAR